MAVAGSLAVGAALYARQSVQQGTLVKKREQASIQAGTIYTPEYWANRLRAAFNPSGVEALRDLDFTDVTGAQNVARGMRSKRQFFDVSQAYLTLTGRNVVDDLRTEFSARELQDFYKILSTKPLQ